MKLRWSNRVAARGGKFVVRVGVQRGMSGSQSWAMGKEDAFDRRGRVGCRRESVGGKGSFS